MLTSKGWIEMKIWLIHTAAAKGSKFDCPMISLCRGPALRAKDKKDR